MIDTKSGIAAWHWLSRMHQLALELNTDMKHSAGPILKSMYKEGLIDVELRGTKKNKQMVLAAMVEEFKKLDPTYEPRASIKRALEA